jgi:PPOX class probable F420-dependent enzyme
MERIAAAQYVLLTTFRAGGQGVATPVWVARDGDHLVVWTEREAGKVKRIRRDSRVRLVPCDVRGNNTRGEQVSGHARVLDDADSARVRRAIGRKYGLVGRVVMFFSRLRGGSRRTVGLAVTLDE